MLINRLKPQTPILSAQWVVKIALVLICLFLSLLIVMEFNQTEERAKQLTRVPSAKAVYWNWFRGSSDMVIATSEQVGELADAKINATLLGVMIAGNSSSATLKFNGKPEAVYHIGDKLGSNTSIVEIQPYRIVVNQNGSNKQILLKKPDTIMVTEEASVRQEAHAEGFALANMFGAVPVNVGGSSGLKMNNISDEIKILADIQDGDIVVKVDGLMVQSLLADPTKWMRYSSASSLPVTVIRQGKEEIIYVNAASLSAKMLPNLGLNQ